MKLILADLTTLSAERAEQALRCFPTERREEIARCIQPESRLRSIVAESVVRLEIAQTLRLSRDEIAILRTKNGKPQLSGFPSFQWNISHSGGLVVCAFDILPIGIDVEKVRHIAFRPIAARCFSPCEQEELECATDPLRTFFRIWTAKESAVKQRGSSLARDVKRLNVAGKANLGSAVLPCKFTAYGVTPAQRRLVPPDGEADYVLTVCTDENAPTGTDAMFRSADDILRDWVEFAT